MRNPGTLIIASVLAVLIAWAGLQSHSQAAGAPNSVTLTSVAGYPNQMVVSDPAGYGSGKYLYLGGAAHTFTLVLTAGNGWHLTNLTYFDDPTSTWKTLTLSGKTKTVTETRDFTGEPGVQTIALASFSSDVTKADGTPESGDSLVALAKVDTDEDNNGLPDWWELKYFGHTSVDPNALALRGDGLTNLQAWQQGLNPNDFYNGQTPIIAIVSGNSQTGNPGGFLPAPLIVSVSDSSGNPIANAPVTFSVTSGGGTVQKSDSGTAATTLTINADGSGQAKVFFKLPNAPGNSSQITATTGTGSAMVQKVFSESSDDGTHTYTDPFAPTNIVSTLNPDGSADVSWTNNTDDETSITISYRKRDGTWQSVADLPQGTTSYHIPPQ
jgi:hypothetical protein